MSRWSDFLHEQREHREIRQKLQDDEFDLV
jgi:hypothetical protein